jgi:hypothetical protein
MQSDDGGNVRLIEHNKTCTAGYMVTILEGTAWADNTIDLKESSWKEKLLTRKNDGLNAN